MKSIVLLGLMLVSQFLFAAGYERSVTWGAETAGLAGIATPQISGSQSIYFNPAGLANGSQVDVSLNLSPIVSQFKAPIADPNTQVSSEKHWAVPGGLTGSYKINDKLGVGLGAYVSGGAFADYEGIVLGNGVIKGDFNAKTDLAILEIALGAGYKVNDKLSLGAAYRMISAMASLATIRQVAPTVYAQVELADLKATNYQGFKLGAQYKLGSRTTFGFTYRSEAVLHAKGVQRVTPHTTGGVGATSETGVTVGTVFPAAWTLGVKQALPWDFNIYGEYNFTEYSKVDNISVQTDAGASTPIQVKMADQHVVKIAGEYVGLLMPIRAGLLWGSQVTNADYALPTAAPPGQGLAITGGTGLALGQHFRADGGLEYGVTKGTATGKGVANEVNYFAVHLGGTLTF